MRVIKRYSNRKLYDSAARRYITLGEIGQAVRQGQEVQVIDHASGADLTTLTLMQVLFGEEKRLGGLLPFTILIRLLQAGETHLGSLRQTVETFLDSRESIDREIHRRTQNLVTAGQLNAAEAERLCELLLDPGISSPQPPTPQTEPASSQQVQELLVELDRLVQSLAELE